MLCEKCGKNEATFYYYENVNGNEKNYKVCPECAAELESKGKLKSFSTEKYFDGFDSLFGKSFFGAAGETLDNLFGSIFAPSEPRQISEAKRCPNCGMTVREFSKTGKVGCPECYVAFEAELEPVISRIHGGNVHAGKTPVKFKAKNDMKKKIEAFETEQKEAVKNENYERAAELRDELKRLREDA